MDKGINEHLMLVKKVGLFALLNFLLSPALFSQNSTADKPNVLVIMIDDLNDCIETLSGHPQSLTPNISKLAKSGVTFQRAYSNAPMCGPSRASLFTGIYPHNSRNFYQAKWFKNEVLNNSRTMMEQFKDAGYNVIGTGKILHHLKRDIWTHFENPADYSPTPFDGKNKLPHPDVPKPFSDIGWVDGSLGPFINLEGRTSEDGKPLEWMKGNPTTGYKPMGYINDDNRDPTPDEVNSAWTANKIKELEKDNSQPFFLAVGFIRPHTPLVAPQKYFDRFPLDKIKLTVIKSNDAEDTHLQVAYMDGDVHALRFGKEMFEAISAAYGSTEMGLKKWTQAYLACVAAVDDNVGEVLEALDNSSLKKNTIVVLASDHGFHMGEKDYLYKNSLWEESTRVPLIMRIPQMNIAGNAIMPPVSLIDVYPTLIDLAGLSKVTMKNTKGHSLDGKSLLSLLKNPNKKKWKASPAVLSAVYAGDKHSSEPSEQHYSLRTERYTYILYNTGGEELYDNRVDPYEWVNLADHGGRYKGILKEMRRLLKEKTSPYQLIGLSG